MANGSWGGSEEYDLLLYTTDEARRSYYRTLGEVNEDGWTPAINPKFLGGAAWPTRPTLECIRNGARTTIASSGLSDPIEDDDGPNVGFGVELAVATTDAVPGDFQCSWLFEIAIAVSNQAAEDGRFLLRHNKFGLFLFGIRMAAAEFWESFTDAEGYCGFLVGQSVPGLSPLIRLPSGEAVLLVAKLLTRSEYEYAAAHGPEGARHLGELFSRDGSNHLSSLGRVSVI